jgi:hypothetical protein
MKITVFSLTSMMILYFACSEQVTPPPSVSHPPGWNEVDSENFHGKKVLASGIESCESCHGEQYEGGRSKTSCYPCHQSYPHAAGWIQGSSDKFHGQYIAADNWDLTACQSCHGADYSGAETLSSCLTCHAGSQGPESCNTCHGNFATEMPLSNWAPPEDLSGDVNTNAVGVGAHQQHLVDSTWTVAYTKDCSLCHIMPWSFNDPTHIDDTPGAEIQFGIVATDSGNVTPVWNSTSATCENVYCHGNFVLRKDESANDWGYVDSLIVGNNPTMVWNQVGTDQAACGTCHGLPPTGHVNSTVCSNCHGSVVDADNNIIDKTKHINAKIELF